MLTDGSERGAEIDCGRCLAHSTLLVGNRQHAWTRRIGPQWPAVPKGTSKGFGDWSVVGTSVMVRIPQGYTCSYKPLKLLPK